MYQNAALLAAFLLIYSGGHLSGISRAAALAVARRPRSGFVQILLGPKMMMQIGDALIEGGATRINTHSGTGQTVVIPSIVGGIGAPGAASGEHCGKGAN
jgi:hypothetical protein